METTKIRVPLYLKETLENVMAHLMEADVFQDDVLRLFNRLHSNINNLERNKRIASNTPADHKEYLENIWKMTDEWYHQNAD